jgi:hypothetical protein
MLFSPSWHQGPIAYMTAKETHDTYEIAIRNFDVMKALEIVNIALCIISDMQDESGRWENSINEVINDYSDVVDINKKELRRLINGLMLISS